jgi:hypothetical protein
MALPLISYGFSKQYLLDIDFQIINFTRIEGGGNTSSISQTDDTVKLFMWKSIAKIFCSSWISVKEVYSVRFLRDIFRQIVKIKIIEIIKIMINT